MKSAVSEFTRIIMENKSGRPKGIYSVCSAHEPVILSSMKQALDDGSILLVESTSNQVDQFGGYTGMTPADFVLYIHQIAGHIGFPENRLLLGGDHLGPNGWQDGNADEAMAKARELVRQYVAAGYQKIHLDCSMRLADDEGNGHQPLADEIVAQRAASLCKVAEKTWAKLPAGTPAPVYIIGTEVPTPGGATEHEKGLVPTSAADARKTVELTRDAFMKAGVKEAWDRVCALVVQPGVEFGDDQVFDYDAGATRDLIAALDDVPHMVFEAHSTDYQTESSLSALTEGHFCIQKVGPWLTYAWREALFALADIEAEVVEPSLSSRFKDVLEEVMVANPQYWKKYYFGTAKEQYIKRKYSYSDRSRYYWPNRSLNAAVEKLFSNLRKSCPSPTLFYQYLPAEYHAWRAGQVNLDPRELAEYHVRSVLKVYSRACRMDTQEV